MRRRRGIGAAADWCQLPKHDPDRKRVKGRKGSMKNLGRLIHVLGGWKDSMVEEGVGQDLTTNLTKDKEGMPIQGTCERGTTGTTSQRTRGPHRRRIWGGEHVKETTAVL